MRGSSDANVSFERTCTLLVNLGFVERIEGDHHIFEKEDVEALINIQPKEGKIKPYQVRQIRQVLIDYKLKPL